MNDIKTTGATDDIMDIKKDIEQLKNTTPEKVRAICAKLDKLKEKVEELAKFKAGALEQIAKFEEKEKKWMEHYLRMMFPKGKENTHIHVLTPEESDKMLEDYHYEGEDDEVWYY